MKYYLLLLTIFLNACSVVDKDTKTDTTPEVFYLNSDMFTDREVSSKTKYIDEKGNLSTALWVGEAYGYDKITKAEPFFSIYYNHNATWIRDVDTRISYTEETKEIAYEAPAHNLKYTLKIHNHRVTNIRAETLTTHALKSDMFTHTSPINYTDATGKTTSLQWTGENGDKIEKNDPLFSVYYASSDIWIHNIDTKVSYTDNTKEVTYEDNINRIKYTLKIDNRHITDIHAEAIPLPPSTGKLTVEMFQHDSAIIYTYTGTGSWPFDGDIGYNILNPNSAKIQSSIGNLTTITYDNWDRTLVVDTSVPYNAPNDIVTYQIGAIPYVVTIENNIVTEVNTSTLPKSTLV